jgi:hypothetical protein
MSLRIAKASKLGLKIIGNLSKIIHLSLRKNLLINLNLEFIEKFIGSSLLADLRN